MSNTFRKQCPAKRRLRIARINDDTQSVFNDVEAPLQTHVLVTDKCGLSLCSKYASSQQSHPWLHKLTLSCSAKPHSVHNLAYNSLLLPLSKLHQLTNPMKHRPRPLLPLQPLIDPRFDPTGPTMPSPQPVRMPPHLLPLKHLHQPAHNFPFRQLPIEPHENFPCSRIFSVCRDETNGAEEKSLRVGLHDCFVRPG